MNGLDDTLNTNSFPDFILAGPGKAGTTALYYMLRQHPQIFLPSVKEPRFFAYENTPPVYKGPEIDRIFNETTITNLDEYLRLYENTGNALAIGDASPVYMHIPKSVETIRKYIPDAKIIILLRHPSERAYSAYLHYLRDGYEKLTFHEALLKEAERTTQNWGIAWRYFQLGLIGDQIELYLQAFDRPQIFFIRYDIFLKDNIKVLNELFSFLGVDPAFNPILVKTNIGGVVQQSKRYRLAAPIRLLKMLEPVLPLKYRKVANIWRLNLRSNTIIKPEPPREELRELTKRYENDILKTSSLTGFDLSDWLKPGQKFNET